MVVSVVCALVMINTLPGSMGDDLEWDEEDDEWYNNQKLPEVSHKQ